MPGEAQAVHAAAPGQAAVYAPVDVVSLKPRPCSSRPRRPRKAHPPFVRIRRSECHGPGSLRSPFCPLFWTQLSLEVRGQGRSALSRSRPPEFLEAAREFGGMKHKRVPARHSPGMPGEGGGGRWENLLGVLSAQRPHCVPHPLGATVDASSSSMFDAPLALFLGGAPSLVNSSLFPGRSPRCSTPLPACPGGVRR